MKNLRWTIIGLVCCLTSFFVIGRMGSAGKTVIQPDAIVYGLVALSCILVLLKPHSFSSAPSLIMGCVFLAYLACKLLDANASPLMGGKYTYLSITELSFLELSTWLSIKLSERMDEFELAVKNFIQMDIRSRVMSYQAGIKEARDEVIRSRRYSRPLGVIIVEPEPTAMENLPSNPIVKHIQQTMVSHYVFAQVGRVLSNVLRRTDRIIEQREKGRFIVLCPETVASNSGDLVDRIQGAMTQQIHVSVTCGAASFPDESYTLEDLIEKAQDHLEVAQKPVSTRAMDRPHKKKRKLIGASR